MKPAAGTAIRRLRVPAPAAAPARRMVERCLADLAPQRYGLPPAAVLVVRRVRVAWPAWSANRMNDPLATLARQAVRPATAGCVGAAVNAVWFADEAELLACLARDVLGSASSLPWWWSVLLGRAADALAARQHWQASARFAPLAMAALEASGADRAWVQSWGREGRAAMLQALATEFPVGPELRAAVAAGDDAGPWQRGPRLASAGFAALPAPAAAPAAPVAPARPDAATAMLRLMRLLRSDPQRAADPAAASVVGPGLLHVAGGIGTPPGAGAAPTTEHAPALHTAIAAPPAPQVAALRVAPASVPRRPRRFTAAPAVENPSPVQTAGPAVAVARPGTEALAGRPGTAASPPTAANRLAPADASAAWPSPALDTRYGGAFFLLNAALALGFYGDFTRPLQPGLPVSPWRFLHDAASCWIGRGFTADPLHAWLQARLADTAAAPPLPAAWQVQAAWLEPFCADPRPWHAVADADGLWLQHPAGFMVARQAGAGAADLAGLLDRVSPPGGSVELHRSLRCHRPPHLLAALRPLVAARIGLALGMPAGAAVRLLLTRTARLQAAAARLDLHFSLAHLPLALRFAGLDRDPGWIPAAGCDVRFHFD
jgi:hypothetical protein